MKFTELKNFIAEGGGGVFLLQGDDEYFLSSGERMLKDAYLQNPELNFASFEGESLKGNALTKLTDALCVCPFMGEKRVVKVSGFYPSEADYERYLKDFFADFPSSALLIIVNRGAKKGACDLKRKHGVNYVDCGRADEETVTRWIYLTLKRAGVAADAETCMNIARWCLCSMARVSMEVKKITILKQGGGTLTGQEAEELVYKDADYRIYEMTDAVAAGNHSAFYRIADELVSKGTDTMALLNSLFSYFRNLCTISDSDLSDAQLAAALGIREYGVKRSREQARRMGSGRAAALCRSIYSAISSVKCGELSQDGAYKLVCAQIFFPAG